jgi:glycosyltransferase involved in cell wall biosynthesis
MSQGVMVKPEYVFIIEDKMGGVAYFNANIINNTSLRDQATIKVILVDQIDSDHPRFPDKLLADETVRFAYSSRENKFAVLRRLHALLGESPGAVICNDGLEMEAIYLLGTRKTVFQVIHDFYNIRLAVKFGAITDVYVTHTRLFRDVLLSAAPDSIKSFWLHHGVRIPARPAAGKEDVGGDVAGAEAAGMEAAGMKAAGADAADAEAGRPLRIVFAGRLVDAKGVRDLYPIHELLRSRGIAADWTIIGRGPLKEFLLDQWKAESHVRFASPDSNKEVMEIMSRQDIFLLPTRFEGSPVTILEALSCGLVPVVSDLPGGISEIVSEDIGKRVPIGDTDGFAIAIQGLHQHRQLLKELSINCRKLAEQRFDISKTADDYFGLFRRFEEFKRTNYDRPPIRIGFRLDQKWLPNSVVRFLRRG